MNYEILNLDPKSRAHFSIIFWLWGTLSWCTTAMKQELCIMQFYHPMDGKKEKQHHGISLKIHVSNISPGCLVPWEPQTRLSPPQGSHIVFVFHDFCCLCVLPMKVSGLFFGTCSFALLIPSWLAHWEALHRERAVTKQAFVFEALWYLSCCCFLYLK